MSFQISEMTYLRSTNPKRFKQKLVAKINQHGGALLHIAHDLGVGRRTVTRWVAELDLQAKVDAARETKKRRKRASAR